MSIGGTVEVIDELQKHNKNCFIIANQLGLKGTKYLKEQMKADFDLIHNKIGLQFKMEVLPLRYTSTFKNCLNKELNIIEQASTPLLKKAWKEELLQFNNIIKRINNG